MTYQIKNYEWLLAKYKEAIKTDDKEAEMHFERQLLGNISGLIEELYWNGIPRSTYEDRDLNPETGGIR